MEETKKEKRVCAKCKKYIADQYHNYPDVCICISIRQQQKIAKQYGITGIKYPKKLLGLDKRYIKTKTYCNKCKKITKTSFMGYCKRCKTFKG
jgi:hypothetical protein